MKQRLAVLGGTAAAALAALSLLVLGTVFIAVAGPRASENVRTRALRQAVAAAAPTAKVVTVTADWNDFVTALGGVGDGTLLGPGGLTAGQAGSIQRSLRRDLPRAGVPLGPARAGWAGLSTLPIADPGAAAPAQAGGTPEVEILYRSPLAADSRLVSGRLPDGPPQAGGRIPIAVTQATAVRFALHAGSRVQLMTGGSPVGFVVTGILGVRGPSSSFWTADPAAAAPQYNPGGLTAPPYWLGAAFTGAGSLAALQNRFADAGLALQWDYPLRLAQLTAAQAPGTLASFARASAQAQTLAGPLNQGSSTLVVSVGATPLLTSFLTAQNSVQSVLSLLFAGLGVIGVVVLALAAQMIASRRAAEFALLRARGARLSQLAGLVLRDTAAAVLPAAAMAAAAAVALTPGGSAPLAWWLAGVTVLAAWLGPAAAVVVGHRPLRGGRLAGQSQVTGPENRAGGTSRRLATRRWVAEAGLTAAAVAGVVVLRTQGVSAGGTNTLASAVPVLVAVPAAIIVMRLYPLVLRATFWLSARRAGVTGFLAVARAGRAGSAAGLPAFALVLALSLAAFAGMVRDTVHRGEVAASWRSAGADASVSNHALTPAQVAALAKVPGAQHTAEARVLTWSAPNGDLILVIAVDPAQYATLTAATPFPALAAGALAHPVTGGAVPVLASATAARYIGPGVTALQVNPAQPQLVRVRVAGRLAGTPALPALPGAGGSWMILPDWGLPAAVRVQAPTLMLFTGPGLDGTRLTTLARRLPGAHLTLRAAVLARLSTSPLSHGAELGFVAAIAAAAGFSVATLLLDLALGAAEREATLARLATMGLATGQARRLTLLETLPAVLAAVVAGACCALLLAPVAGPALQLSVFTGSAAHVPVRPDLLALLVPAAGLLVLATGTLFFQVWSGRRRGVTTALRVR